MIRAYRTLVLTDHTGHSDQNSIYAIVAQMNRHHKCHSIDIASRGLVENEMFFVKMQSNALFGSRVTPEFKHTNDGLYYSLDLKKLNPKDYDLVLMRLPRPISDAFLFWLEEVFKHAIIINKPEGIIATSNKKFLLRFPELCPNMRLCNSIEDIKEEVSKHPIVLKPLKEYGGRGILKIDSNTVDDGYGSYHSDQYLEELKDQISKEGMLSMKYLKNVVEGDKRIIVVGGEILAASLRLPAEGSWLCNVAQGGSSKYTEVTAQEEQIVKALTPTLIQYGILIFGVDTLVNDNGLRILSEVNTMSIGGFPQAEAQTGKPIINTLLDKIFDYADEWAV